MKKSVYERKNSAVFTGTVVKNDAFVNAACTVAHFRMAVSSRKDTPTVFLDCVMFAQQGRPFPTDLLCKGSRIEAGGYFKMDGQPARDAQGQARPRLELVVTELRPNRMVEIEVPDGTPAAPAAGDDLPE